MKSLRKLTIREPVEATVKLDKSTKKVQKLIQCLN